MCGIVGYVGRNEPTSFLINALEHLEYRGYDSSGIAVCGHDKINLLKRKGRISVLKNELKNTKKFVVPNEFQINVGIAHTRWATHGVPSDVNAHPFVSNSGKFAVVHNGIIENYVELKASLRRRNVKFSSQTDSEVVCALIDSLYDGDFFNAVKDTVNLLEGSFALEIICSDFPNKLICVKKDSPLIIGKENNEFYIASDVSAFIDKPNTLLASVSSTPKRGTSSESTKDNPVFNPEVSTPKILNKVFPLPKSINCNSLAPKEEYLAAINSTS